MDIHRANGIIGLMGSIDNLSKTQTLIFTDLDGSLLDHYSYSFEPAKPTLTRLEQAAIPVICCTSKTFSEVIELRKQLHNHHPFIVENGAAVYIPDTYFSSSIEAESAGYAFQEGYHCFSFVEPRAHWLACMHEQTAFKEHYSSFCRMGDAGIAAQTGLSLAMAARANQRQFGEPLQWLGTESDKQCFIQALEAMGASVLQGGRFMHVSGQCNKGLALQWLVNVYQQQWQRPIESVAAGDSHNDIAMLEVANKALIIRSPEHEVPTLNKKQEVQVSDQMGPLGWAEGITDLLSL